MTVAMATVVTLHADNLANAFTIVMGLRGEVAAVLRSLMVLREIPEEHFADSLDEVISLSKRSLDERRTTA